MLPAALDSAPNGSCRPLPFRSVAQGSTARTEARVSPARPRERCHAGTPPGGADGIARAPAGAFHHPDGREVLRRPRARGRVGRGEQWVDVATAPPARPRARSLSAPSAEKEAGAARAPAGAFSWSLPRSSVRPCDPCSPGRVRFGLLGKGAVAS